MQKFPGRPGAISGVGPVRAGSFGKRQEDRRKPVFRFDSSVGVDVTVVVGLDVGVVEVVGEVVRVVVGVVVAAIHGCLAGEH